MHPAPPNIRALIRRGAEIALNPRPEWLAEIDAATLAGESRRVIADDPVLAAAIRRANRANLLWWAAANLRAPGEPVPANEGEEPLAVARDLVRRGLDESALDAYRVGETVAIRRWTQIACTLTTDPAELAELLDVSLRSIAAFIDATVAAVSARMRAERAELTRGTLAERRELVTLLLEGAPITRRSAEHRLGYALQRTHTAAVIWADDPAADLTDLDRAADALAGDGPSLRILASAATRWLWVPGRPPIPDLTAFPAARLALGAAATGVDGFRRSHLDALTTQRMLARLPAAPRAAAFDQIELVALLTHDTEAADRFVTRTLGPLATAPPDIVGALRAYIAAEGNASRAASGEYTHRNTLLRRLTRAEALLPRPLAGHVAEVAAALEILRWRAP